MAERLNKPILTKLFFNVLILAGTILLVDVTRWLIGGVIDNAKIEILKWVFVPVVFLTHWKLADMVFIGALGFSTIIECYWCFKFEGVEMGVRGGAVLIFIGVLYDAGFFRL